MTEIKLDGNKEVGWYTLPGELRALSCGDYDGKDMPLGLPTALRYLADAIEEQVKPAIEEQLEYGSVVRAPWNGKNLLWIKTAGNSWWSESGIATAWSELRDPEVLRVGIGEDRDVAPEETSDYMYGVRDTITAAVVRLRRLRADALTAERQNAYDKAIAAVEATS